MRRRVVVRPVCPIVVIFSSSPSSIRHSLLPRCVAHALLSLPSWKVVGLRLGEVLELGVRSPTVSVPYFSEYSAHLCITRIPNLH